MDFSTDYAATQQAGLAEKTLRISNKQNSLASKCLAGERHDCQVQERKHRLKDPFLPPNRAKGSRPPCCLASLPCTVQYIHSLPRNNMYFGASSMRDFNTVVQ